MQKKLRREKIIYLSTGSQGEPMGATKRIVNGVHPDVYSRKRRYNNFFFKNYTWE